MNAAPAPAGQPTTTPHLCKAHWVVLQSEAERRARPGGGIAEVISGVVNGRPLTTDALFGAVADLFGIFNAGARAQSIPPGARRAPPPSSFDPFEPFEPFDPFGAWTNQQRQREEQAPEPVPSTEELARARKVFSYAPGEVIDKNELKRRYRKLSLRHHPDRKGGSAAKMAEVNHSHDLLQALV